MRFVIVTGMSGAGKSTALKFLEDSGYYCADNLPVPLIAKFVELLMTKDASGWPMKGVPLEALNARFVEEGFSLFKQTLRTSYWRTPDGLVLEATRCACALGCEHCEATRGDSFTGGTHYHPCFLSDKTIPMADRPLEDVLSEGEDYLRQFINAQNVA